MGKGTAQAAASATATAPAGEEDIWGQILNEAASKTKNNTTDKGHVLLLGDRSSGKTSLVSRMQGLDVADGTSKGVALAYTFLDVYEDDNEDPVGTMNLWQLEGEAHMDLLHFALNPSTIDHALVLICLDFSQPWTLAESLRKWLGFLTQHLQSMKNELPKSLEEKLRFEFQTYAEPLITDQTNFKKKKKKTPAAAVYDDPSLPPLDPNILTTNLGVPVVVVCCKCDSVASLEQDFDFKDQSFEYIQQHLRRMCLAYGASLVYTSSRKDVNCSLLLELIEHKLFNFDMRHRPQLLLSSSSSAAPSSAGPTPASTAAPSSPGLFVPAGWDSLAKINIDFQNQTLTKDPDEPFENVVKKPGILKRREQTVASALQAEDDQDFLNRHKATIERDDSNKEDEGPSKPSLLNTFKKFGGGIVTSVDADSPAADEDDKPAFSSEKPAAPEKPEKPSLAGLSGGATAASGAPLPPNAPEKAILKNFFSSLMAKDKPSLKRETSKNSLLSGVDSKDKARQDAERELERMRMKIPAKK